MNPAPLVSLVIPAAHPRFFRAALQSALDQTWEALEIIVCDDCQTGEVKAIFDELVASADPRARYVANSQRLGFEGNLLKCLAEARGEFIKFLCDDDLLYATCVDSQARALIQNPDAALVTGWRLLIDSDDRLLPARMENSTLVPYDALFMGNDMLALFKKTLRNYLGGFSCALMRKADVDELLPALAQPGQGFLGLLDFALFLCLLRRGHLIALSAGSSSERLHPDRLSKRPDVLSGINTQWQWLEQMLEAREGEAPPAPGYVRFVSMRNASQQPRDWDEVSLYNLLGARQGVASHRVGCDAQSYTELYTEWLACRTYTPAQKKLLARRIDSWSWQPRIVPIIIDEYGDAESVEVTLESLASQDYPAQSVVLLSHGEYGEVGRVLRFELQNDWVVQVSEILPLLEHADWVYLLRAGDRLVEPALLVLAERVAQTSGLKCIYSDEGAICGVESVEPIFKPDFNLDLMRAYPYVGRVLAFERQYLLESGLDPRHGELAPHDAIWRLVEAVGPHTVGHIAEILVESKFGFSEWLSLPQVVQGSEPLVAAHLRRIGVEHVIRHDRLPLLNRIEYRHAEQPLISIIVTIRDQLGALERCLESVFTHTAYPHYEVLIVDRNSQTDEARGWLSAMAGLGSDKLRIISAGNDNDAVALNLAAQHARGDYLLLLSAYTIICESDWIGGLLNHALRPEVGIVGPRIVDTQGRNLYAGLVLGMEGIVGRPGLYTDQAEPGYLHRLELTQNWSALNGSCLMVRKEVFNAVGPLDEQMLTLGFNDLDLCLSAGRQGYLVVWTPDSRVILLDHSAPERSTGFHERLRQEQQDFCRKWLAQLSLDPAYNHNLALTEAGSFQLEPGLKTGWNPFCSRHLPCILGMAINTSAVGHYRLSQPLLELQAAGRVVGRMTYETPSIAEVERLSPDVVVIQGRYSEAKLPDIERIKAFSNAMRIFELDDYIIDVPLKNEHRRSMPDNMESVLRRGMGMCDRVVVSTQPLADALSSMHSDIRVVPNMLAPNMWDGLRSSRRTSDKPRIGWGGGTSHRGDLELIAEVIRELADEVEWVFFGMCPDLLRPYIHEYHKAVHLPAYPAKLASLNLDLAVAPLETHIFNDCKSNLRLLEYGACGYPVVCSDTLAYRGHLPATRVKSNNTQEWLEAIRMHLSDPDASYRMGDELRETVLRDFMLRDENLQYWANGWLPD
ncbi:glycosyltransferase [Pseudomonas sp. 21LCFQ010]|uniref:glycosyltransferase n=1 Tax=Pseudomonas sp. 21LCFQ010 TaxID=2957506 RepID=UPI0020969E62|nr:glycosyltransferase [Pseudomonas sp. 21LCFQ010]